MWDAYNHFMPPNSTACAAANDFNVNPSGHSGSLNTTTYGGWGAFMDALPPSSNHPGGVNIAFADGFGAFAQEPGDLPDVVGARHSQRPGSPQLRRLLI